MEQQAVKTAEAIGSELPAQSARKASALTEFGIRAGLSVFGLILALVLFEIMFRVFSPKLTAPVWRDLPKEYYLPEASVFERDFAYSAVKPPNTYRIVVVGDSFTYSGTMQIYDTFTKRLERYLNLNKVQPKVEVINYSHPGLATVHEKRYVREALDKLQPDLILLQITLNDPEPVPYQAHHQYQDEKGRIVLKKPLFRYWKSLGFIAQRITITKNNRDYEQYYQNIFNNPENWSTFSESLRRIALACEKANVRFGAVIFPLFSHPMDARYPFANLHDKIHVVLDSFGVKYLDLFAAYRNIPNERLEAIPNDDPHPSETASRIAADEMYRFLRDNRLIPAEAVVKRTKKNRHPKDTLAIEEQSR